MYCISPCTLRNKMAKETGCAAFPVVNSRNFASTNGSTSCSHLLPLHHTVLRTQITAFPLAQRPLNTLVLSPAFRDPMKQASNQPLSAIN